MSRLICAELWKLILLLSEKLLRKLMKANSVLADQMPLFSSLGAVNEIIFSLGFTFLRRQFDDSTFCEINREAAWPSG